jgi:hypothetical protein
LGRGDGSSIAVVPNVIRPPASSRRSKKRDPGARPG